jgi:hypothetical protein
MQTYALATLFALAVQPVLAQTGGAPQPNPAPPPAVAPPPAPAQPPQAPPDICQEFLAFMQEAQKQAAAPPPPPLPPEQGSAVGSAQELTGQSGPAVDAPKPVPAPHPLGSASNAPQTSGLSAPIPLPPGGPPKDSIIAMTEVESIARSNDPKACREAVQRLRRAGVPLPPTLLALAAAPVP